MEIRRRSFLAGILGACVAPSIVRASSLMPSKIVLPGTCAGTFNKVTVDACGRISSNLAGKILEIQEDGQPAWVDWKVSQTVESQITTDRWYTPPERVIQARPFIPADELNKPVEDFWSFKEIGDPETARKFEVLGINKSFISGDPQWSSREQMMHEFNRTAREIQREIDAGRMPAFKRWLQGA